MKFNFGDIEFVASSTDRIVFPDEGLTKGDVLGYYAEHASLIVPELAKRPLTVERWNKGVTGTGFYQKHAQKFFPSWLETTEVRGKKTFTQPVVNRAADLVYMANQNALTFHVPTTTIDAPGYPDRFVFDLDPPPGRFDLAIAAAREIHALLAEVGLAAFVKTTGSKGLHIAVPLDGTATTRDVNTFGEACASVLCARRPDIVTTEFYKRDRGGRLLLDMGRNAPQATVVAAYSIRARPGAPVSLPLAWEELDEPGLRPDGLGVAGLPARIAAVGDLWAGIRGPSQGLTRASELIGGSARE